MCGGGRGGGSLSALAPSCPDTGVEGAYSSTAGFSENRLEFPQHPWVPWPGQELCCNVRTEAVFCILEKGTMLAERQSLSELPKEQHPKQCHELDIV